MIPNTDERDQYHEQQRLSLWGPTKIHPAPKKIAIIGTAIILLLFGALAITGYYIVAHPRAAELVTPLNP